MQYMSAKRKKVITLNERKVIIEEKKYVLERNKEIFKLILYVGIIIYLIVNKNEISIENFIEFLKIFS